MDTPKDAMRWVALVFLVALTIVLLCLLFPAFGEVVGYLFVLFVGMFFFVAIFGR
jgi:hypothetical protein